MNLKLLKWSMQAPAAALFGVLIGALPAVAHHSFAMFDFSNTVKMQGTVKEFRWSNPHVVLLVATTPKPGSGSGETEEDWSLELTSPGNLTRLGWSRKSLVPGDRIDLEFNPLRDGRHGGAFSKATLLATGQVLTTNLRQAEMPDLK